MRHAVPVGDAISAARPRPRPTPGGGDGRQCGTARLRAGRRRSGLRGRCRLCDTAAMIRTATPADVPVIHTLIRELAEYEKAPDEARATREQLFEALFGEHPAAFAHVAQAPDGEVVGFALWFLNFSTWRGVHGIYLEDLYVRPEARGAGHGKALLRELARICAERGYERLEWSVLDWNRPSIAFYESLGARPQDEWTVYRLTDGALTALARQA
ncbi:GNAT family N-acetyltransferase [Streptomyces sp. NPDC046197]|uniref:GNAT family N-acetyltransferase n=1 Tax=Streptomyces sp. NPDC046197 TaxID=3154337 RepID=UPI0033CD9F31